MSRCRRPRRGPVSVLNRRVRWTVVGPGTCPGPLNPEVHRIARGSFPTPIIHELRLMAGSFPRVAKPGQVARWKVVTTDTEVEAGSTERSKGSALSIPSDADRPVPPRTGRQSWPLTSHGTPPFLLGASVARVQGS